MQDSSRRLAAEVSDGAPDQATASGNELELNRLLKATRRRALATVDETTDAIRGLDPHC